MKNMPKTIKKPAQKATVYTEEKQKISIKYVNSDNKTYIFKMEDNKVQNKIDNVCKNFKNISHNEQAELLAKITDQI